jgi:SHS family lactate transporter-like MFS transporter
MQSGYPMGYLFAAIAVQLVSVDHGWRIFFFLGAPVALLVALLTWVAPESRAWEAQKLGSVSAILKGVLQHKQLFLYLLVLMSVMLCLSHGTQDLYPDFLKSLPHLAQDHVLGMKALYGVPVLYNVAAIVGAWLFGALSERIGRRFAIMAALFVCLISIEPWAYGASLTTLIVGSCLMQAGGQGAFGVIPAHMNELSPSSLRGLFPGFVYQLGVLVASPATMLQIKLREHLGYRLALTEFSAAVILCLFLLFYFGPEAKGREL